MKSAYADFSRSSTAADSEFNIKVALRAILAHAPYCLPSAQDSTGAGLRPLDLNRHGHGRQFHGLAGDWLPTNDSVPNCRYGREIPRILIAAAAAPKPLSMFIVMTPGAQLESAVFRAAAPPAATP